MRRLACLALLSLFSASYAWIDTGHMLIADIAHRDLKPRAAAEAERLLKFGGDDRTRDILGAACWADDFKTSENGPWHYIDHHFRVDGKPSRQKPDAENAVWAIEKFSMELVNMSLPDEQRARALRFLLHLVGDIHMPLHCVARDTEAYPTGDRGGNDFKFEEFELAGFQVRNLHFLWDIACGLYGKTERPLSDHAQLDKLAEGLRQANPRTSYAELKEPNPRAWSLEGLAIAKTSVYNLPEGKRPSEEYLASSKRICERRLTLAGYRLSDLLNRLLAQ